MRPRVWQWIGLGLLFLCLSVGPVGAQSWTDSIAGQSAVNRLLPEEWPVTTEAIETAPIYLDGRTLFYVSAPAAPDQRAAESRAQEIQQRLNELAKAQKTSETPAISVTTDNPSNLPEIVVDSQRLLTVTNLDAQMSGHISTGARAYGLVDTFTEAFTRYRLERQPDYLWRQGKVALGICVLAAVIQLVLTRVAHRLKQRQQRLAQTKTQLGKATSLDKHVLVQAPAADSFTSVFDLLKARLDNRQKRKLNEAARGLVFLAEALLWIGGLLWILSLFPFSRWLTTLLLQLIQIPARILLIAGLAYAAVRLSSLVIDKVALTLQEGMHWAPDTSRRVSMRFSTFSQVAKGIAGSVIFVVTLLLMLTVAGVQVGPLLAGAGIAGVGISLAAQGLIKDFINGFFILFEDQFGVGDVITVEGLTGTVELINLRITQLRDLEGRLITIPNSRISIIQNLSKDWSQVDLSIAVSPSTDLLKAMTTLKQTAVDLSEDSDWRRAILEPPDLLGVETVDYRGITLRLLLKTQPLQQWRVARELRKRIKDAFDTAEIEIGVPQEKLDINWGDARMTDGVALLAAGHEPKETEPVSARDD
ncbi:MAG: mechanosensitive ion channel family protein [Cyanobacteria bacterium J06623_5]